MGLEKAACLVLKCYFKHRVSLDAITKSVQCKFNCVTVVFSVNLKQERTMLEASETSSQVSAGLSLRSTDFFFPRL